MVHPIFYLDLTTALHRHHKQYSLWRDSRGSTIWSDISSPGMLLHQCHHRPLPLPGEGVCVGGIADHRPSITMPKRTL